MVLKITTIKSSPFMDQKPGTSGLRKPTKTFIQSNYTENFVQAIINSALLEEAKSSSVKLVVGGDGRYFVEDCVKNIILPMCAANQIAEVIVGRNGVLSTPAVSHLIRKFNCNGGILLTASHNPGGINADFGIKYNCNNGGPAPEKITSAIFEQSKVLNEYNIVKDSEDLYSIDLNIIEEHQFQLENRKTFKVSIVDSTEAYCEYMKEVFDFESIKTMLSGSDGKKALKLIASGMNGVMGPYINRVLSDELGMASDQALKCVPLPDFGGDHPDPNLTYAADLVSMCSADASIDMACAFDGDGDRNMVIGAKGFFVSPCDSIAVIADHAHVLKYFKRNPVTGFARSMPTSRALDKVCEANNLKCHEVPTGWKFFGNLMDSDLCCICGEESFGAGSNHIREKDGMWAVLSWLSILAHRRSHNMTFDIPSVLMDHWKKYGRYFFTRYDFEGLSSEQGEKIMNRLKDFISNEQNVCRSYGERTVMNMDSYSYKDPVDNSISTNQGIRIFLDDGTRFVFRLSGTGSSGATLRMYVDKHEEAADKLMMSAADYLKSVIQIALEIAGVKEITSRDTPTVIT